MHPAAANPTPTPVSMAGRMQISGDPTLRPQRAWTRAAAVSPTYTIHMICLPATAAPTAAAVHLPNPQCRCAKTHICVRMHAHQHTARKHGERIAAAARKGGGEPLRGTSAAATQAECPASTRSSTVGRACVRPQHRPSNSIVTVSHLITCNLNLHL